MTLVTIAQDILRETKNATIPTTIINNNQDSAKQVLEALNIAIINVARSYDWQQLQKEYTFSSVASTEGYALPSDFDRIIDNTFWNTTNNRKVLGPTSPKDWRSLNDSTVSSATINDYFRVRASETLIFPTPTGVENFVYEYISNEIVDSSGGTGQTGWKADNDVPNVDEYLVRLDATWRLLSMQGKPYAEKQREFDLALAERVSKNSGNKTIKHFDNSMQFDKSRIGYPDIVTVS
jgi:hypothetical protein